MAQSDRIKTQIVVNRAMSEAWSIAMNAISELEVIAMGRNVNDGDREVIKAGVELLSRILEIK